MSEWLCAIHRLPMVFQYTSNSQGRVIKKYACAKGCKGGVA